MMKSSHRSLLLLPLLLALLQLTAGREYSCHCLTYTHRIQNTKHNHTINRNSDKSMSVPPIVHHVMIFAAPSEEKLQMIQTVISLTKLGDSIELGQEEGHIP